MVEPVHLRTRETRILQLAQTSAHRCSVRPFYLSRLTPRGIEPTVPGRLLNAWKGTPTKWYPIPVAVGALLLVALQYRKKLTRTAKEVNVDREGHEVIRLKGPWQVR